MPGRRLTTHDKARIAEAVDDFERRVAVPVEVRIGRTAGGRHADEPTPPALVVEIDLRERHLQLVTPAAVRDIIPDDTCAEAVAIMLPAFRHGDLTSGVELGLAALRERLAPARSQSSSTTTAAPPSDERLVVSQDTTPSSAPPRLGELS